MNSNILLPEQRAQQLTCSGLVSPNKTMWIPILLMCSLPVSGALSAAKYVKGVVGRAITIDCHYTDGYRSHTKYWCRGWDRQCSVIVETNWQHGRRGRVSITDNPARGLFTVTVEDLHSGDTGWYSCGITTPGNDSMFSVHLRVSDEPASVPLLGFLSLANASYCEDSVTVSCESVQGSLPIAYAWYQKTPSVDSKISNTNKLDLHCQSLKDQHYQYYCTASNVNGIKSSKMVNVSISNNVSNCRNVIEVNSVVSGALWAEKYVRGVVGRAITIDCHYTDGYRSHTKYWCRGWDRQYSVIVETNGQHGRRGRESITDNPARGIFTVTVEDLHSGDTGWYTCGITTPGLDPMFTVHLVVSDEAVSVPVLGFLSPANASRLGGSVSVSCESVQGSLPIQYTWYEKTPPVDSKVSNTSELDLHCQTFKHRHHQYYCTASNNRGAGSSEMVNVTVFKTTGNCSYGIEINGTLSGGLWAEKYAKGVVGRAITIDCHYAAWYRSHTKYWCRVRGQLCTELVQTTGQNGQYRRGSMTDNPTRGTFTVTMENVVSEDTGWYRCGITTPDKHPIFDVHLQVSDEPLSVPVLGFLSPANVSHCEDSVTVTCESAQGSLPITYAWYEKTLSVVSNISNTSKLDLHCQSLKDQHYQYYCTASNVNGTKSSKMVNVSFSNNVSNCRNVIEVNSVGLKYFCETFMTESTTTAQGYMIWSVGRWVLFALLVIWSISVTWFTRDTKRSNESVPQSTTHEVK
ncbi:polymeric immunoglobulin receptor-like [Pristis pectinata]|uniref:polymeric immunoglobulin receptor-like n=1 Tax=Pristis pectinata TaxID=685728 RepID=UPI00223CB974|nr:polymeric immunoglobulin receptor-like [Pristis pectinata]